MDFNVREDAALGSAPDSADSPAGVGFAKVHGATRGFVPFADGTKADGRWSAAHATALILKEREAREEVIKEAEKIHKDESRAVGMAVAEMRKAAELDVPVDGSLAMMIVGTVRKADKSGVLDIVMNADPVTARCLLQVPGVVLGNALPDYLREVLESRLLESVNPAKYADVLQRKEGLGRLAYAIESGRRFLDRHAGIASTVRERIERERGQS